MGATEQAKTFVRQVMLPGRRYAVGDLWEASQQVGFSFCDSTLSAALRHMARQGEIVRLSHGFYSGNFNDVALRKEINELVDSILNTLIEEEMIYKAYKDEILKLSSASLSLKPIKRFHLVKVMRILLEDQLKNKEKLQNHLKKIVNIRDEFEKHGSKTCNG